MKLLNAQMMHIKNPKTFSIPSPEELQSIAVGDHVKLGFLASHTNLGPGAERMWVLVTAPGEGTLANDPVILNLKFGNPVKFHTNNVLSIMKADQTRFA